MLAAALRAATLLGTSAILITEPSATLALWSVVVTSAAGLFAQVIKMRGDGQREERNHRFAMEDRASLAENTKLTRENGIKADAAYDTANHVNEKIASIASAALTRDRATANSDRESILHDITADGDLTRDAIRSGQQK